MKYEFLLSNLHLTDINPRICGNEACAPCHSFGPAIREYHLLHYVVSGKGKFYCGGQVSELQPGDIFVIRPGEVTFYQADSKTPWEYSWVGFDCSPQFAALLQENVLKLPSALGIFSKIVNCGEIPAREWYICGQLFKLFAQLSAACRDRQNQAEVYVRKAINYIESNYAQPLKVEAIAKGLGLSRNYFCRIFHQQAGRSPQDYIVSYRLEKAAEFLTELGLPQEETARLVGYPDVFSFSRMFKRKYGVPPGQYVSQRSQHK